MNKIKHEVRFQVYPVKLCTANSHFNSQVQVESKNFFGVSRLSKPVLFKTYKSGKNSQIINQLYP